MKCELRELCEFEEQPIKIPSRGRQIYDIYRNRFQDYLYPFLSGFRSHTKLKVLKFQMYSFVFKYNKLKRQVRWKNGPIPLQKVRQERYVICP